MLVSSVAFLFSNRKYIQFVCQQNPICEKCRNCVFDGISSHFYDCVMVSTVLFFVIISFIFHESKRFKIETLHSYNIKILIILKILIYLINIQIEPLLNESLLSTVLIENFGNSFKKLIVGKKCFWRLKSVLRTCSYICL